MLRYFFMLLCVSFALAYMNFSATMEPGSAVGVALVATGGAAPVALLLAWFFSARKKSKSLPKPPKFR